MIVMIDDEADELRWVMAERLLCPVFQPIIDFRLRAILGYEALIRGPEGSSLQRPDQLFAAATRCGLSLDLEHACREASLRAFAAQRLAGRLFLNVTPGCLLDPRLMNGYTRELLSELGIAPNRIVLELTENQKITDMPGIHEALLHYRGRGFQIAIDDLGEGFANLRMWSELRPEFVKIDKHFVSGIADDRIKFHFVRAMQDLAEICNASLVAEGIECLEDFVCLRDMGIACGQGFFIARPTSHPIRKLPVQTLNALDQQSLSLSPLTGGPGKLPTARNLARPIEPVPMSATNATVIDRFESDPGLDVLPVVQGTQPVGMINRHSMIDRFARPFRKELFGRKSCELFMDHAPLIVDQHATIQELAMMLSLAPKHYQQPRPDGDDYRNADQRGALRQPADPAAGQRADQRARRPHAGGGGELRRRLHRHRQFQALQRLLRLPARRRRDPDAGPPDLRGDRRAARFRRPYRWRRFLRDLSQRRLGNALLAADQRFRRSGGRPARHR
jgi:EAL domain-containing protein (putative c-di-GMP-specific phosphodiesterase class I)